MVEGLSTVIVRSSFMASACGDCVQFFVDGGLYNCLGALGSLNCNASRDPCSDEALVGSYISYHYGLLDPKNPY